MHVRSFIIKNPSSWVPCGMLRGTQLSLMKHLVMDPSNFMHNTGAPDFNKLATHVVEAGHTKDGVTVEQVAASMKEGFRQEHRVAETHGNDAAVVSFPPWPAAPTGGLRVSRTLLEHLQIMEKHMQAKESRHQPSPELLQQVATAGYAAALAAARQDAYEQGLRDRTATAGPSTGVCLHRSTEHDLELSVGKRWEH